MSKNSALITSNLMRRPTLAPELLVISVSVYIATVTNLAFWARLLSRTGFSSAPEIALTANFFLVLVFLLSTLFFIFGRKTILKSVLVAFLVLSATISYFNAKLGIIIDKEMIRNILETILDRNVNEARELVSVSLLQHIFIFGVLPSLAVLWVRTNPASMTVSITRRTIIALGLLSVSLSVFMSNYKYSTYFIRENEEILQYVNLVYPLVSVKKYVKRTLKSRRVFHEIGNDAVVARASSKKIAGILVIGETARADHFQLNGYHRQTNPVLAMTSGIINFTNVSACGTSTAYSVPCMFSFFDREHYSPEKASQYSNVLDVLEKSGVKTVWEENNSSCKGVCRRIEEINLVNHPDPGSPYYNEGQYYDEKMLENLDAIIENSPADILLVLHTMGSHGPLYYQRVPEKDAVFKPYCQLSSPQDCTTEEIINAYDNTIVYTDYVLGQIIEYLEQQSDIADTFMVYVSDHGESLGEDGIYLHGLPYIIAPEAQTHVPMLMWLSEGYVEDNRINTGLLKQQSGFAYSHDNLSHTLLGMFGVSSQLFNKELAILQSEMKSRHHVAKPQTALPHG